MPINNTGGVKKLEELWKEILKIPKENLDKISFIDDELIIKYIRDIIKGKNKSYKYALLTQVLAKALDPSINALALQKQASIPGAFDARSFCRKVIIAFEKKYCRGVIGGSEDPYVSKPLRHPMITLDKEVFQHIKDKKGWKKLYHVLNTIQTKNDEAFTINVLKQILLEIRKIKEELETPVEISSSSISAHMLKQAIELFLGKPSEGARAQSIIYALMRVLNRRVHAFENIRSSRSTVADIYSKRLADIECLGKDGSVKIGISVTEYLDARKLREELDKAMDKKLEKLVIVAYRIKENEELKEVLRSYEDKVDYIINDLINFILTLTTLLNDKTRREFLEEVENVLKELEYLEHLKEWREIISSIFKNQTKT